MSKDDLIAKAIMSDCGKKELAKVIGSAGAEFADSCESGSFGEALGRAVAGLPRREQDVKHISMLRKVGGYVR